MVFGLKRPLWIASGTVVNGVTEFATPVIFEWNWRTLSSAAEIQAFGPSYMDYRIALTENRQVVDVKPLDRVWMDVTPAEPTDPLAQDADFYVVSVNPGPGGFASVMFKKLSPDAA